MAFDDTLDETLSSALNFITRLVNCDSCFTYVLHGEKFEPWVWKSPERLEQSELELDGSIRSFLAKHRAPAAISYDASGKVQFHLFDDWSHNPGETFVSVPLVSRAKLVGAIKVHHPPRAYAEHEVKFFSALGSMIGSEIAISRLKAENSELYEELETRKVVKRGKGMKEIHQALTMGDEPSGVRRH
jgi:uroporphyrinogen-III synthase